uniref:tRNA (Adenine(37)-N6)-methyltransferase n=1 Tax=Cacopsylla melanoneura TaxID=428564 RepID=A0A8D8M677_9HEMI
MATSDNNTDKPQKMKLEDLNHQLKVARNEMNNLRTQLQNLSHAHHKQVKELHTMLKNIKIKMDQDGKAMMPIGDDECTGDAGNSKSVDDEQENSNLPYKVIGTISTRFKAKRGIPRQATICLEKKGKITLSKSVFTNPEHSLEGLQDFSHMWIIFHFHKNVESTHIKAKVSPPRLDGTTVGVFSTRSPYRPTPIGLSLVTIDKVEESTIFFSGVDMLDGTPVLDIKPYIPQYDDPYSQYYDQNAAMSPRIQVNGVERDPPDGAEGEAGGTSSTSPFPVSPSNKKVVVDVPSWIKSPPVAQLNVVFEDRARAQLESIAASDPCKESGNVETTIRNILREDPRSVYVRKRFKNQFYTFQIDSLHVSCKFNDDEKSVLVYRVNKGDSLDLEDSQAFEF